MKLIMRLALVSASVLTLTAGSAFADYELNILHINDLHSRLEAINKYDSTCSTEEASKNECLGGFARVKSAIDNARSQLGENANILVLDAGDQFQGSLFYTEYKSAPIAELMNTVGFDAMAVGNHEFDDGPTELLKLAEAVNFPIISGNTLIGESSELNGKIKPYIVKELGGEKIGILSVLATDTDETASPGDKILFADEISYLNEAVKELEAEGINKIILLSHAGYERDQEIAKAVNGIDIIVGGHSHTLLSNTDEKAAGPYPTIVKNPSGIDVPIVTAYAYSKYLGDLKIIFDDNGNVKTATGEPLLLDASVIPDEVIAKRISELALPLEERKQKEVGSSTTAIEGSRDICRVQECSMGNLVADALLDRVKDQGIQIALQNSGSLRSSIDEGTITMGEVLTVLPFQNTIATFQLKGSDLKDALENGTSKLEEVAGRFLQVAGLRYAFDRSQEPGNRITMIEVKKGDEFVPLDPDKTYGVVANNYLRSGGDGFAIFASKAINPYDFGPSLEDAVAEYLVKNSPYTPIIEDRISEVTSSIGTPTTEATSTKATISGKYVVHKGDSLWRIAAKEMGRGTLWQTIAKENKIKRPYIITPGTELIIPTN